MRFKNNAWILISLLTLVTAVVWLTVTVKDTFTKETVPDNIEALKKPLDPNLDQKVFQELKNRTK